MVAPELITRCLRQDRRAQAELYRQCAPYLLAVVRRYGVAPRAEADLLQDIFIEIFAGLNRYDTNRGAILTWMRSITVFRIIDRQRSSGKLRTVTLDTLPEPADVPSLDRHPPEYLLRLIGELPTGYRTVFNLYAVEGYGHERIGQLLGISAEGSRSQYYRARRALQAAVLRHQKKVANVS